MKEEMDINTQLSLLEARIRDLKLSYDRYFTRDLKLEPVRKKEDVERLILKLSKIHFVKVNQKFTYENIISRFISLKSYWYKRLRTLESAAAKKPQEVKTPVSSPEVGDYKQVYNNYIKLVTSLNPAAKITPYETIRQTLEKKRRELVTQYKCEDVEFRVECEGKKLKFKAIPRY